MKKAPQLFEFAALYADQLHLPLNTGDPGEGPLQLEGSLRMIQFTRPLIDSGIVKPSSADLYLCKHCDAALSAASAELMSKAIELQRLHSSEFTVTARMVARQQKEYLFAKITGPREYLETGTMYSQIAHLPPDPIRFTRETELSPQEIVDMRILDRIFAPSINDFISQNFSSKFEGTIYLSDLPSETEFFQVLGQKTETDAWRMSVLQRLSHQIPVFNDLPLERLVSLRNEEEFAFRNYRNALQKAIRVAPSGGDPIRVAQDIWNEQIRPELERLESKAEKARNSFRKALFSRAVPTGMILAVGLFGSALPKSLSHAVDVIAGCTLIKDMLPSRDESEEQLASEDFYFLLRAAEH